MCFSVLCLHLRHSLFLGRFCVHMRQDSRTSQISLRRICSFENKQYYLSCRRKKYLLRPLRGEEVQLSLTSFRNIELESLWFSIFFQQLKWPWKFNYSLHLQNELDYWWSSLLGLFFLLLKCVFLLQILARKDSLPMEVRRCHRVKLFQNLPFPYFP